MSFSRSFTFHVSGSVHYPASEHGGSVSYSDSVHVVVNVDTSAFDREVDHCHSQVLQLENTVVAAGGALIEEKANGAHRIASALIKGFKSLITRNISDKMVSLQARLVACMNSLRGNAERCESTSRQLQDDYTRISSQYAKTFEDLDKNLKTALTRLDRPVFDVSETANAVIHSQTLGTATAETVVSGPEQWGAGNALEVANVKGHAKNVIEETARNIGYNLELTRRINYSLARSEVEGEHRVSMPVVMFSADGFDGERAPKSEYFFSGRFPSRCMGDLYEQAAAAGISSPDVFFDSRRRSDARELIDSFFKKRLSEFASRETDIARRNRLSNQILEMWNKN